MYAVYKGDEKIYEGKKTDVVKFLNCSRYALDFFDSGYLNGYWVQKENAATRKRNDNNIPYLEKHLSLFGNTVMNINALQQMEMYQQEMKKRGLDFTYRIVTERDWEESMKKIPRQFIICELKK